MIGILLVLALGTRLYQLDVLPYGHNNDATRMALNGYQLLQEARYSPLVSQSRESTLPYLYGALVEHYGFSNAVIRYPSAILGIAGCLCLCLLMFRILPEYFAFSTSLVIVTYGPYFALDRLALRASVCAAAVFVFLLAFFVYRSSERRLHWFILGCVFGLGFHTYNAYRVMPVLVAILLVLHFREPDERAQLGRKLLSFVFGAMVGGINLVYLVLTESPARYLWREADLFSHAVKSEAGLLAVIGQNLASFLAILLGHHFPRPVGAEVGYFHLLWVPLLIFGVYAAARAGKNGPEFALLIGLGVFLLPGLLSTEMFARRILTALVLVVALAGIGLWEAARRLGLESDQRARAVVMLLAVSVASWNLFFYFVRYSAEPRWEQGPFFAAHRWIGPTLRERVGPETKVIFAYAIEDPWMLKLYFVDRLDVSKSSRAFLRLPAELDEGLLDEVGTFCSDNGPVLFLYRGKTSEETVRSVRDACSLSEKIPIEWPGNVVPGPDRRVMVLTRPDPIAGECGDGAIEGPA